MADKKKRSNPKGLKVIFCYAPHEIYDAVAKLAERNDRPKSRELLTAIRTHLAKHGMLPAHLNPKDD